MAISEVMYVEEGGQHFLPSAFLHPVMQHEQQFEKIVWVMCLKEDICLDSLYSSWLVAVVR